jgi:outer membrane protein OmpA-like peptidoglycan-associated protein
MLGNQYVAISFGSAGQGEVKNGQIINSQPPLLMADMLNKANDILNSSQQAVQNVTVATAHIASVTTKIDQGDGTVGALINDKQLYDNLEQTTTTLHDTMLQAQTGVTDFQENMEALKHNFLLSGFFKKRGYEDEADLAANGVSALPQGTPLKTFTFAAKQLFDGRDSAKLKNQKALDAGGAFLADNQFGFAVIVVSTGMEGDTQQELVLTEARAMVVRNYLVDNFGFDDSQLKTLGMGKQPSANAADWGTIQILVFPVGASIPPASKPPVAISKGSDADQPMHASADPGAKP